MESPEPVEITRLLRAWGSGDKGALEALTPQVYNELRRMARRYMQNERAGRTIQATALVNEVYLKLADVGSATWQDRVHFFAVSANYDAADTGGPGTGARVSQAGGCAS